MKRAFAAFMMMDSIPADLLESKDLSAVFLRVAAESDARDVQFVLGGKSRFAVRTEGWGEVRVLFLPVS